MDTNFTCQALKLWSKCLHARFGFTLRHVYLNLVWLRGMGLKWLLCRNHTPIFGWYEVWGGSKNKLHKDTCLKKDWNTSSNANNYSTINNEHHWEDLSCIQFKNQQTCTSKKTIAKSGEIRFSIWFLHMFHRRFTNATP